MHLDLTGREAALLGAMIRKSEGWDDPTEWGRFVTIAHEYAPSNQPFTDEELQAFGEKVAKAWLDRRAGVASG